MKFNHLPASITAPLAALTCLVSVPAWSAPQPFVLVEEGRPAATIVTAATPSTNAQAAALELQRYVRKITEAELPIVRDDQPVAGALILVGTNRFTGQTPGLQIPSGLTPQMREEGFVIRSDRDRLLLAGNDAGPYFGTRYAVGIFERMFLYAKNPGAPNNSP